MAEHKPYPESVTVLQTTFTPNRALIRKTLLETFGSVLPPEPDERAGPSEMDVVQFRRMAAMGRAPVGMVAWDHDWRRVLAALAERDDG